MLVGCLEGGGQEEKSWLKETPAPGEVLFFPGPAGHGVCLRHTGTAWPQAAALALALTQTPQLPPVLTATLARRKMSAKSAHSRLSSPTRVNEKGKGNAAR